MAATRSSIIRLHHEVAGNLPVPAGAPDAALLIEQPSGRVMASPATLLVVSGELDATDSKVWGWFDYRTQYGPAGADVLVQEWKEIADPLGDGSSNPTNEAFTIRIDPHVRAILVSGTRVGNTPVTIDLLLSQESSV